jgi:hypothetical protein
MYNKEKKKRELQVDGKSKPKASSTQCKRILQCSVIGAGIGVIKGEKLKQFGKPALRDTLTRFQLQSNYQPQDNLHTLKALGDGGSFLK